MNQEQKAIKELLELIVWMAGWINEVGGRDYHNAANHVRNRVNEIKKPLLIDTSIHEMD